MNSHVTTNTLVRKKGPWLAVVESEGSGGAASSVRAGTFPRPWIRPVGFQSATIVNKWLHKPPRHLATVLLTPELMSSNLDDTQQRTIVGIGEALFDCFDDRTVMGGAPLNATLIAYLIGRQFDLDATIVSRIGRDALGDRLVETLRERGLDGTYLQIDPEAPTGRVRVEMIDGEPHYEIIRNVAWDRLAWNDALATLAPRAAGITFGTLAQRSETSRETIQRFLAAASDAVRLFDVNLRQSFYDAEVLRRSCEQAHAVKLNSDELRVVAEQLSLADGNPVDSLRRQFDLRAVVLTHGARGTELITAEGSFRAAVPRFPAEPGADPVGAGDACGAACLVGLVLGWPPQRIVIAANRLGAYVASRRGATPTFDSQQVLETPESLGATEQLDASDDGPR